MLAGQVASRTSRETGQGGEQGVSPQGTPPLAATDTTPSPTEQRIDELMKRNEKAQGEFYEKLAAKLGQPPEGKSSLTGIVGVLAALLTLSGALIAARVAYLSFSYNYQNQLRTNSDTRFFEAMQRFGDKDSAAVRSSAAGLLAVMGKLELRKVEEKGASFFGRFGSRRTGGATERPYTAIALSQLLAGHSLEENPVVLDSINTAITELCPLARSATLAGLEAARLKAEEELVIKLAAFFALLGAAKVDTIGNDNWAKAAAVTGLAVAALKNLVTGFNQRPATALAGVNEVRVQARTFEHIFNIERGGRAFPAAAGGASEYDKVIRELRAAARRISANAELQTSLSASNLQPQTAPVASQQ